MIFIYTLKKLIFMHKNYNNKLPSLFETMFTPLMDRNRTRSYMLAKVVNKYTDNFPAATFSRIWNKIDIITKEIRSLYTFKNFQINKKNFLAQNRTAFHVNKCLKSILFLLLFLWVEKLYFFHHNFGRTVLVDALSVFSPFMWLRISL